MSLSHENKSLPLRSAEENPALLFLHGNGGCRRQWREQVRHFSSGGAAVAVDLPGFGESVGAKEEPFTLDRFLRFLEGELEALSPSVLVAHSLSSSLAVALARNSPGLFRGLLLLEPAPDFSGRDPARLGALRNRFESDDGKEAIRDVISAEFKGESPSLRDEILSCAFACDPEAFLGLIESLFSYPVSLSLRSISLPVRILSTRAKLFPDSLEHALRPEDVVSLPDSVSHWAMMEEPDLLNRKIRSFLEFIR